MAHTALFRSPYPYPRLLLPKLSASYSPTKSSSQTLGIVSLADSKCSSAKITSEVYLHLVSGHLKDKALIQSFFGNLSTSSLHDRKPSVPTSALLLHTSPNLKSDPDFDFLGSGVDNRGIDWSTRVTHRLCYASRCRHPNGVHHPYLRLPSLRRSRFSLSPRNHKSMHWDRSSGTVIYKTIEEHWLQ